VNKGKEIIYAIFVIRQMQRNTDWKSKIFIYNFYIWKKRLTGYQEKW